MPFLELPDAKLHYEIDDHTDAWTTPETVLFVHGFTENLDASVVFKWTPATPPSSPGLSQIFTFAWDLNDATAFNNGLSLSGAYGVPAPGAMALLGVAGLFARRRR